MTAEATPSPARSSAAGKPRIPKLSTPVKLGLAGAVLGLGYAFIRDRKAKQTADTTAPTTADGTDPYANSTQDPNAYAVTDAAGFPVGYVSSGAAPIDSGQTVGAVGQTALDTVVGLIPGLVSALAPGGINPTVTLPASAPPPPATASAGAPGAKPSPAGKVRPTGYHPMPIHTKKGAKNFPGAVGFASVSRAKGVETFHVAFKDHHLEDWHYDYQGKGEGTWRKVNWTGHWS